jgi:hypothetical protein
MSVTEEIIKEAVSLDFTQQRELLMFVKFLKTKKQGDDDADFKKFWNRLCGEWKMSRIFMMKPKWPESV